MVPIPAGTISEAFVGTGPVVAGGLLAAAALCWPSPARPTPRPRGRPRPVAGRTSPTRIVGALAGTIVVLAATARAGPAGFLAAAMLGTTGLLLGRRLLAERRRRRALPDILRGLHTLNRELRAGADPVTAVDGARRSCRGAGADVLGRLAVLMRAGGAQEPPPDRFEGWAGDPSNRTLAVLTSGWLLSRRHGVAFGRVVSGIADELSDGLVADQERAAQLAGPRMSGYVMAGLPLMGVLLGTGMGVDPVEVLLGSAAGRVLLVVGVALMCCGLLWSARIVGR